MFLSLILSFFSNFALLFLRVGNASAFPPVLSVEKEREYFRLYKEKGDMNARGF